MKYLYKYPQARYPYEWLVEENRRRAGQGFEFELLDTGIFDADRYFDVFVEYVISLITACSFSLAYRLYDRAPFPDNAGAICRFADLELRNITDLYSVIW